MTYRQKRQFIVNFCYYGILFALAAAGLKFLWEYLAPFVLAFVVAYFLKPVVNKVNVYLKIRRSISAILCVRAFYAVTIAAISFAGIQMVLLIRNMFYILPDYYSNELAPVIAGLVRELQDVLISIDPGVKRIVEEYASGFLDNLAGTISTISMTALARISSLVTNIPGLFIKTLFTVIASFFISVDYYNITYFIAKQLNTKQVGILYEAEIYAKSTVIKYLRSYSIILFITFVEISLGLKILGISHPLVIGGLISIFDILPAVGTGGIILPWGVIAIIMGNIPIGLGMFALYLVITVVRNTIEPKIVGKSVGLHPVATLMGMVRGSRLRGVVGLFGVPILMVVLKQLNDSGKIKLYK